jgi:RNA polymerase sigma-70 factor (ECF subfamily)
VNDNLGMTDADRFEAFVVEYQDMVFATAVRLVGNPAEAEDIAQTVFLKAFERFGDIETSATAPGWLKTVTTNACLNYLSRYRRRWRLFSELSGRGPDDDEGPCFEDRIAVDSTAVDGLEASEQQTRLEAALRGLPDHQRVPLVLFHFEHKSYQAIADQLAVSLGKVKTDIHRGREALRQQLRDDDAPI